LLLYVVSPPLPPPPSAGVDDRSFLLQSRAFDPRYSAIAGTNMQYAGDYGHDGYTGRRSQIEEEEEAWVPENYLEKGQWSNRIAVSSVVHVYFYNMQESSASNASDMTRLNYTTISFNRPDDLPDAQPALSVCSRHRRDSSKKCGTEMKTNKCIGDDTKAAARQT